jgi:hypothetical protein
MSSGSVISLSCYLSLAACVLLLGESAAAQQHVPSQPQNALVVVLTTTNKDSVFQLADQFIVSASDSVVLDSARTLLRNDEYKIDYRWGRISFDSSFTSRLFLDRSVQHSVMVVYRYLPFRFQESYFKRRLLVLKDSTGKDTLRVSKPRSAFGLDDIFGQNLQKSGSIVRGFTVGSNRDFSLNSGLRLQLAGKLTSDLEVVAALTDENTPIQPEGTSQTLQEFDKVFVELRSTDATGTLGDFNLDLTGTEFARLSRKLQGAKVAANYRLGFSSGSTIASAATTRGKFNTNQFQGIEAVQGPYRLTGTNNERQIIIIAGTERVYHNGEVQIRGETNDYTIDYSNGEVTFTPRRLITSASRITVDFEYTDRQFSRSLLAGQNSTSFFGDKVKATFSFLREADDPDAPMDFSLTDSARKVFQDAGDDRSKAVLSGITRVDSNGYYVSDSVVIGSTKHLFYRYAPGRDANYIVTFSNVGFGQGEYIRKGVGIFEWKGPRLGDYLPVRLLPLPTSAQVFDFGLDVAPSSDLRISGEYATSRYDANRLSSLHDEDNSGHALKFEATYAPRDVRIGGTNIGSFDFRAKERFINKMFVPVDRANEIEFNRKWGIETVTQANEEIQEASLRYAPSNAVSVGGGFGKITRGSDLRSVRNDATLSVKGDSLPTISYYFENVRTRESQSDNYSSWYRQNGTAEYQIDRFVPIFKYENENRRISYLSKDSLKSGSFAFNVFSPGLRMREIWGMSLSALLEWRTEDKFYNGTVVRESKSLTQAYSWKLAEWNSLSSSLDVTLRKKKFSATFKGLGNNDIQTVLVRNQTRYAPFDRGVEADMFYEVSTERSSRLERVFVRVAVGTGNYKYIGDLNNNGIADESEFVLTRFDGDFIATSIPSDQLYPVIDLKTSARVRVTPSRFISQTESTLRDVMNAITTESYVRVEEKSSEPDLKQIYLLHFSRFRSDSTISGSTLFTQDINVLEGRPEFSARFRYSQRKGLNKFASSSSSGTQERSFTRERSVRLRWQLVTEIANQIDFVTRNDRVSSTEITNRLRDIVSNSLTFDLSYRPYQNMELGMKFEVAKSTDRYQTPEVDADLNAQSVRLVYAFQGAGQARVEASREEILLSRVLDFLPFELTGGRVSEKTYIWRAAFDYRVTQFVQATLNYDGRTEGGRSPVHTARAEVRAFF